MKLNFIVKLAVFAIVANISGAIAGTLTVCDKNTVIRKSLMTGDSFKNSSYLSIKRATLDVKVNGVSTPQDTELNNSSCQNYSYNGSKATVQIYSTFPGAEYFKFISWLEVFPLKEVDDGAKIYVCQGLRVLVRYGGLSFGYTPLKAWHYGSATVLQSDWDTWDEKCGKASWDQKVYRSEDGSWVDAGRN
jgi:hypothetical protein